MLTIDEAHCISQWGQDFRPSYLKIVSFIRKLPVRPVLGAFTATATEKVKEDIQEVLGLERPYVIVTGFDRANLYFEVQKKQNKKEAVLEYLEKHREDSGIIYCATRKNVDELYLFLENAGYSVGRYHAGMENEARKISQENFIYDRTKIMAATNAFGMGIDKSNVRFVLHYNMPQSLENYYQEAGRAGRDGEEAECILLYSPQDVMINQFLLDSKENNGEYTWEELQQIRAQDQERLRKMTGYCTTRMCLRRYILAYFGEQAAETCGNCSNCLGEFATLDAAEAAADIVRCVGSTGQRFGSSMIIAVLLGENTARLRSYHLEENEMYGKQSKTGKALLKEIIYAMEEQGYLCFSNDRYALLKLTPTSGELLGEARPFLVSYKKEEEKQRSRQAKKTKASASGAAFTQEDEALFEELRRLRMLLAKERSIPPYMVASDKTLHDLCAKRPRTKEEMLEVNGVGEKKYEQYGKQFLACVRSFQRNA